MRLSPSTCARFASVMALVVLAGCAVGPNYQRPDLKTPAAYKETNSTSPTADTAPLASDWWTLFQDATLTRLAEQTLQANLDVRVAMARVDEARAATRGSRSSFWPSLSLDPSVRRGRSVSASTGRASTSTSYSLPLDLGYELDVWGRLRRQVEYYQNLERASAADLAVVRQTALADLAQAYFSLRLYAMQKDVLARAVGLYRRQLDLTDKKFKAGLVPQTDALQAQNQIDQAETQLIELERQTARQEHAIAVLLGLPPAAFVEQFDLKSRIELPVIPPGLPATLLSRRPDVAEAEHQLIAANAQVGGATANFYPTLSLTGSAGFESVQLSRLTDWENRVWSVSPGLTLPIFQGGKLRAGLAQAKANYEAQLATYKKTVLGAYRDVEDQLSDLRLLADEARALGVTLHSAQENVRLLELQYKQGLTSSLQLITADQEMLSTELSLSSVENDRLIATVLLIKAIGGGWNPESEPAH